MWATFGSKVIAHVKIGYFSGNFYGKITGIEASDEADPALAVNQGVPEGVQTDAVGRNYALFDATTVYSILSLNCGTACTNLFSEATL